MIKQWKINFLTRNLVKAQVVKIPFTKENVMEILPHTKTMKKLASSIPDRDISIHEPVIESSKTLLIFLLFGGKRIYAFPVKNDQIIDISIEKELDISDLNRPDNTLVKAIHKIIQEKC